MFRLVDSFERWSSTTRGWTSSTMVGRFVVSYGAHFGIRELLGSPVRA
jgi:hypothetical protein